MNAVNFTRTAVQIPQFCVLVLLLLSAGMESTACLPTLPAECSAECSVFFTAFARPGRSASSGEIIVTAGTGLTTSESGGTAFFTVVLDSQPAADVAIAVSADDATEGKASPESLNFNAANWNAPQSVTVTGVDDGLLDGDQSYSIETEPAVSTDVAYNAVDADDVSVVNQDNDTPNIILTQTGGTTVASEGGATDSYSLVLGSQPTANVTIAVTPDAQVTGNGFSVPFNLVFTAGTCPGPGSWCQSQTVTVAAVDDAFAEGNHSGVLSHTVSSADVDYAGMVVSSVIGNLTDNDIAGVTIAESGGTTTATEGGAGDSYTVGLKTQPTSNVTFTITPDAQLTANASAVPISLNFTAGACPATGNWCTLRTVNIAAVDDALSEGIHSGTLTQSFSSGDPNYNGSANLSVTITDNDTPAVSIVETGGTTVVTEGGATDTYSVRLMTEPTANVTVTVSPDTQLTANASATPISLHFTNGPCPATGNWCTPQVVVVAPVNDSVAEGPHSGTISHTASSGDSDYDGIGIAGVTASITDNETAGISVTQSAGSTTLTEAGGTDSYTLVLTSEPAAPVSVKVTPDSEVLANSSATPIDLNFTTGPCPATGNWCTPQAVTASAVDDASIEGAHTGGFAHAVTSADPAYNSIGVATVTASIGDNEKYTFRTASQHDGDFDNDPALGGNSNGTGIDEADQFCNIDSNKPSAHTYKALLVDAVAGRRTATSTGNVGDGQFDWALTPNTDYYRADGTTLLFQTGPNALFIFGTAANSISATAGDYWTGFAGGAWESGTSLLTCNSWTYNLFNVLTLGGIGDYAATDRGLISKPGLPGVVACNQARHLVCVMQ